MLCSVGLANSGSTKFDVLQADYNLLIQNVELDASTRISPSWEIFDWFVSSYTDAAHYFLHPAESTIPCRDTVIVGHQLVVDEASLLEITLNYLFHLFTSGGLYNQPVSGA